MRRLMFLVLVSAIAVGCSSERRSSGPPSTVARDGGAMSTRDGGPDVVSSDGGVMTPDAGRQMYCGDQICSAQESCMTCAVDCGPCTCDFGFAADQMRCVPDAPEPFRFRTTDDICRRWRDDFIVDVGPEWMQTTGDMCDLGVMTQATHNNAILRTNLYRWLVGLDPVVEEPSLRDQQQACAVVMEAIGSLTHNPPSSAPCYTADGAAGAGSSNIAFAGGGLARSVDLYVGDRNVATLGHRRWAFNPSMGKTTFGYKPPFSCMHAFDQSGTGRGDFVAYPPPGWVPAQAASGEWSFNSRLFGVVSGTTVEIDTGTGFMPIASEVLTDGFGAGPIVKWQLDERWRAGEVVRVAIRGTSGGDFLYTVAFFDCP